MWFGGGKPRGGTGFEGENRRLCKTKGLILDEDKTVLVRAEATFAILSDEDLYLVPDKVKREMDDLFKRF